MNIDSPKKTTTKKQPSERPTVVIDLPPILEAFCRHELDTPKDSDIIAATRKHAIGLAINGLKSLADFKPVLPDYENPVTFTIPVTENNWYSIQTKYVFFSVEDTETFIDRMKTLFDNFCEEHFRIGYDMGLEQKEIVESVLDILNVRANTINYDAVLKNDYRKRKTKIKRRSKMILKQRLLAS